MCFPDAASGCHKECKGSGVGRETLTVCRFNVKYVATSGEGEGAGNRGTLAYSRARIKTHEPTSNTYKLFSKSRKQ